mgnify:FL=1
MYNRDQQAFHPTCPTVDFLLRRNEEKSFAFTGEPSYSKRQRYLARHRTQIVAMTCMDGRLDVSVMAQLPPGIVTPFRNIAGRFDIGWPLLKEAVGRLSEYAQSRGERTIVLCGYHYSAGEPCRGCAGNGFDLDLSKTVAQRLVDQFQFVFGVDEGSAAVVPILFGIETDEDAFVFHGSGLNAAKTIPMRDFAAEAPDESALRAAMRGTFPALRDRVANDLFPLLLGNARHIHDVRSSHRPIVEMSHKETVIAVGRGFDWLHLPNKALIIGPFEHNWTKSVSTAASIIIDNINTGRVDPADGIVLLPSALSFDPPGSYPWRMSEENALYLGRTAAEAIAQSHPELLTMAKVSALPGVVEGASLAFRPILVTA